MAKRHLFSLLGVFVLLLSATAAKADRRVALVIGNSKYVAVQQLPNPPNDAQAMARFLRNAHFDVVDAKIDLGVDAFRRALRDFTLLAADADIALVYYAGHGMEVNGVNYLIPVDAQLTTDVEIEDETISLDRILRAVEPARRLRLIILDACRDNPFLPKMRHVSIMAQRGIGRGLSEVEVTTQDTLVAFAAKAGSTAADGDGPDSPFTRALIDNLGRPGLDVRIAFGLVRDQVLKATDRRQEPWLYGSLGGDVLALVPGPKTLGEGGAPAQPLAGLAEQTIEVDYAEAQRSNTAQAWQAFLRLHPSGQLAERARDKLALLTPTDVAPVKASAPSGADAAPRQPSGAVDLPADKEVQLIYSPWTKFCLNDKSASDKQVCFTGKDARIESGMPVVSAVLIEPDKGPKKILRVTLPLGMQLVHGTRVIIDQNQPMTAAYVICVSNGCMADYDANADMIAKMRKGRSLWVQAINSNGQPISLVLPLSDFAKAYDGPPTDPKVFAEQQQKLQEELQKRADAARKKLEAGRASGAAGR